VIELNEAWQAYHQFKSQRKAAEFLNISRSTFRERFERAKIAFNNINLSYRMLLFDLETSQTISGHYGMWDVRINKDDVLHPWFIMSGAWKWYGEKERYSVNMLDDPERFAKNRFDIRDLFFDDYHIVKKLHEVLTEADVLIFQNGIKFDIKKFNTRCEFHGLPPIGQKIMIDLYVIAKRHFDLESNSLAYMCKFFKIKGKTKTSDGLFRRAMLCYTDAIKELSEYNKDDLWPSLEGLFNKLRPYIKNLNYGLYSIGHVCKNCGSPRLEESEERIYTMTTVKAQLRCLDCRSLTKIGKSLVSKK